jgi:hypothetical protein
MTKISFLLAASVISCVSNAAVAYNSFGPEDSVNDMFSWTIGGSQNQRVAAQFESSESGMVTSVELGLKSSIPGLINILLFEDNNNTIGNQLVAWGHTLDTPGNFTFQNVFPSVQLTAGNKYWLEARPSDSEVSGGWAWNNQGINALIDYTQDGTPAQAVTTQTAFRVNVDAVPEPATMTVLGLTALAALKRRKK